ncbi:MAG: leucine-rich repeat domain-containing protein, partial [Paracoccaceae bacterium]
SLFLNLSHVSDLTRLQLLSALQRLSLSNTQVSDLSPLKDLCVLLRLDLNDTPVSDLSALRDLRKLQVLSLQGSKAADLSPLSLMIDLRLLNLKGSQVADLLPLAGLSRLGDEPDPNLYPIITFGLWFGETPAADRDAAHRALATIENPQDRVKQVLQYLNGEHPEFGGPPEPFVPAPPPPAPEQQKGGVRFRPEDDYLQPLAEGEIGARAEAMKPMVIEALEAMTQPLPGSNDFPGPAKWAVEALMLVRRDLEDIDAEGWRLWALSQKFARRVEADDKAQAAPDGMEKSMGAQMREAVDGVVDSLPLFVRQFPECRYYDTETADRARDRSVEPAVAEVLDDVAAFEIVRPEVGEHLRANLPVEEDGREAGRQAGFNLFTARNVVYAGLGVVAATLVQEVTLATLDAYGGRAALTQRIEQWLTSKPDPIREILKDAPADVRASALTHIERLKASPAPWQAKVPPKKP